MSAEVPPSVALRVKLPCTDERDLTARMARAFSPAGMFLATRSPKAEGTRLRFEVLYTDGSPVLRGEGVVVRTAPEPRPGMTIQFTRLDPPSRALLERLALSRRATPPAGILVAERAAPAASGPGAPVATGPGRASGPEAPPAVQAGVDGEDAPAASDGERAAHEPAPEDPRRPEGAGPEKPPPPPAPDDGVPAAASRGNGHIPGPTLLPAPDFDLTPEMIAPQPDATVVARPAAKAADLSPVVMGLDLGAFAVRCAAFVDRAVRTFELGALPGSDRERIAAARAEVEAAVGRGVERVVLIVPASAGALRRRQLAEAARAEGLEVLRLVSPAAARAASYGVGRGLARKRVLVLDLGAERFAAGVVEVTGDEIEVVAAAAHDHLGAEIEERITADVLRPVETAHGPVPPEVRATVLAAVRKARPSLCAGGTTRVFLGGLEGGAEIELELGEASLEAAGPALDRALALAAEALAARGLQPAQVDEVVLAGGQAELPPLRRRVTAVFGSRVRAELDPPASAAAGAALVGAKLGGARHAPDVDVHEVLGRPVGLVSGTRLVRLIDRNVPLPAERIVHLDGPSGGVEVVAAQGDSESPLHAELVLAATAAGAASTALVRVNRDGLVELTVRDRAGHDMPITLHDLGTPEARAATLERAASTRVEQGAPFGQPESPPPQAVSGGLLGNIRRFFGRGR